MDKKFSFAEFNKRGMGSAEALALSELLQNEISDRLHKVLLDEMEKIKKELNNLKHNLEPYYEPAPGDISYRDNNADTKPCKLRVGVDTIVSIGFGDTVEE